ncbi:MAG: hypothetical protein GYA23_06220 [Methanomicrobiales archaeon]|nr:hypothetical protein [Methanomicrobiales archaeon]
MKTGPLSLPVILLALMLAVGILAAGCTNPPAQPPVVPPASPPTLAVTPVSSPLPPSPSCSLVPGPTQVVPDYESVSITVDRNTISESPTITTTFNGGKGLGMVQTMTVTLIRSDCQQDVQVREDPGIGTSVTQMGTTGTDRVVVSVVMTSGDPYTVIDGLYPFAPKL